VTNQTKTVYVAGRSNGGHGDRKVHTDPDCPGLKEARNPLPRSRDAYPADIDECKICSGELDQSEQDQDHSAYNALVAAAESEADSA